MQEAPGVTGETVPPEVPGEGIAPQQLPADNMPQPEPKKPEKKPEPKKEKGSDVHIHVGTEKKATSIDVSRALANLAKSRIR
jgi:hypothetical protein